MELATASSLHQDVEAQDRGIHILNDLYLLVDVFVVPNSSTIMISMKKTTTRVSFFPGVVNVPGANGGGESDDAISSNDLLVIAEAPEPTTTYPSPPNNRRWSSLLGSLLSTCTSHEEAPSVSNGIL